MAISDPNDDLPELKGFLPVNVLWIVLSNIRLVSIIAVLATLFGAFFAFSPKSHYTSTSKVIRGIEADGPVSYFGGLSLLRGFGVSLGVNSVGMGPDAYPAILTSREVCQEVVNDTFFFKELGQKMTYVDYLSRARSPNLIKGSTGLAGAIRGLFNRAETKDSYRAQSVAVDVVLNQMTTSIEPENGLMKVSVTTANPALSAALNAKFLEKLVLRLEEIRIQKAYNNLEFIEMQLREASAGLESAEDALSLFSDHNMRLQSARGITEMERLERRVIFKTSLYNDLQAQFVQATIDLGRIINVPVITILDHPVVPVKPSGPPRMLIFSMSMISGLTLAIVVSCAKESLAKRMEGHQKELGDIKEALFSIWPDKFKRKRKINTKRPNGKSLP